MSASLRFGVRVVRTIVTSTYVVGPDSPIEPDWVIRHGTQVATEREAATIFHETRQYPQGHAAEGH